MQTQSVSKVKMFPSLDSGPVRCATGPFLARETCDPLEDVFSLKQSEFGFVDCSELSFYGDRCAPILHDPYPELNHRCITKNYAS